MWKQNYRLNYQQRFDYVVFPINNYVCFNYVFTLRTLYFYKKIVSNSNWDKKWGFKLNPTEILLYKLLRVKINRTFNSFSLFI